MPGGVEASHRNVCRGNLAASVDEGSLAQVQHGIHAHGWSWLRSRGRSLSMVGWAGPKLFQLLLQALDLRVLRRAGWKLRQNALWHCRNVVLPAKRRQGRLLQL